jgi:glycosyltransferase involved in cell wall biosynthesis
MKRVVFFHPYFGDGGVERTNLGLAKGLIENGYQITFLTTAYTSHFIKEVEELGIEFVSFGDKKVSSSVFNIVKFLNHISSKQNIYFVSCQYYSNVFSMIASLLVKNRRNIKFINSERNHLDEFAINKGIKSQIILYLVKLSYRFADTLVANSRETAEDLSNFLKIEVKFTYNPTINERLKTLKNEEIKEQWFLNDQRKSILGIGRLTNQKDFINLLKAYKVFNKKDRYKLVILGDGENRNILENYIKENNLEKDIYLPGFVSNPYKFLNQSALFVLSSQYEGLPNVLIEALYLKIPCMSTNCKSGPKEILLDNELLVDTGDYKRMASKMQDILNNPNKYSTPLKKAFTGVDRFTYENSIKNFVEVIEG